MRQTQATTATYQMKSYTDTDAIDITKDDIIVGVDSLGNTWVLIKQTQGRLFE